MSYILALVKPENLGDGIVVGDVGEELLNVWLDNKSKKKEKNVAGLPAHVSIFGDEAKIRNDCGAAAVAVAIHHFSNHRPAVDWVSNLLRKFGGEMLGMRALMNALSRYGVYRVFVRPMTRDRMRAAMKAKKIVIAQVDMSAFPPQHLRHTRYRGWNFFTIVGRADDGRYYINDPLRDTGGYLMDERILFQGMQGDDRLGMPYQAIICG